MKYDGFFEQLDEQMGNKYSDTKEIKSLLNTLRMYTLFVLFMLYIYLSYVCDQIASSIWSLIL